MKAIGFSTTDKSNLPKFVQIVEGIKHSIRKKELKVGDALPSIRHICEQEDLSQETVLKAYAELKGQGIVTSEARKGYFVATNQLDRQKNVFLLFDELSEYKKILYNTLRNELDPSHVKVDIYFHHCNFEVFKTLILQNIDKYNLFVIMPFDDKKVSSVLGKLSKKNVLLLDRKEHGDEALHNFIVQDFDESVFDCLCSAAAHIKKYNRFVLVFPETDSIASNAANAPREIKLGFLRFCKEYNVPHSIASSVNDLQNGDAFFVVDDIDLVNIITLAKQKGFHLGQHIGLLSYNESPIKQVIADGITVISTDFELMGKKVVSYITGENSLTQETVPTKLILRKSL